MKGLLLSMVNTLCKVKSTHVRTCASILEASKKSADVANTSSKTVTTEITTHGDAQEETDRQNMFIRAVIRAKEGITEGITDIVSSNIADAILRTSDGTDFWEIGEYQLYKLINATIIGADQPATSDIHDDIQSIIGTIFNFHRKFCERRATPSESSRSQHVRRHYT